MFGMFRGLRWLMFVKVCVSLPEPQTQFIHCPRVGEDIEKIAAQSDANRKLREALQADTASAAAKMQVLFMNSLFSVQ